MWSGPARACRACSTSTDGTHHDRIENRTECSNSWARVRSCGMGHITTETDIVVDRGRVGPALDGVARTVVRDLSVTCALVTANEGRGRRLLSSAGSDPLGHLRGLSSTAFPRDASSIQVSEPVLGRWSSTVPAHAAVRILLADEAVTAVLWAVNDNRRWFDHDEFHHLRLLADRAEALIEAEPAITLETELVDARSGSRDYSPVASPALS